MTALMRITWSGDPPLTIEYDESLDLLIIDDVKISRQVIALWASREADVDEYIRVRRVDGGIMTLERVLRLPDGGFAK